MHAKEKVRNWGNREEIIDKRTKILPVSIINDSNKFNKWDRKNIQRHNTRKT